jgi:hypothetical protein
VLLSHTVEDMLKLVKLLSEEFLPIVNAGVAALELWRLAVATERNIELSRTLSKVGVETVPGMSNNIKVAGACIGDTPQALLHAFSTAENAFRSVRAQIETMKLRVQLSCDMLNSHGTGNGSDEGNTSTTSSQLMSRKVAEELKLYLF